MGKGKKREDFFIITALFRIVVSAQAELAAETCEHGTDLFAITSAFAEYKIQTNQQEIQRKKLPLATGLK